MKSFDWTLVVLFLFVIGLLVSLRQAVYNVGHNLCQEQRMIATDNGVTHPQTTGVIDSIYCSPLAKKF